MRYHIVLGGAKSGSQQVAIELVYNLTQANGEGTASAIAWGKWVTWRPDTVYDLTKFTTRLNNHVEANPAVEDIVIYGPGIVKHFVTTPNEEVQSFFSGADIFWTRRTDRSVEQQRATRLFNRGNNDFKILKMKHNDTRIAEFRSAWDQSQTDFYSAFDTMVASKTFSAFTGFTISGASVSLATSGTTTDIEVAV